MAWVIIELGIETTPIFESPQSQKHPNLWFVYIFALLEFLKFAYFWLKDQTNLRFKVDQLTTKNWFNL